jgi:hypothetical protein
MANKKVKVEVDVELEIEPSLKGLRELKKELKNAAAGSEEFKKISAQIRDTEDALENAKLGADDLKGSLEAAPGPLGAVFRGLKQVEIATMSFGTALKATGIGLIVALLGGLVAAFSQNEVAMKKLEPLFIGFQKILGGIFRAFEPVLDIFVEMVEAVLPPFTKGIGAVYSVLFGLFSLVKNNAVGVAKLLKGIFTLDFETLSEGAKQVATSVGTAVQDTQDAYKRFEAGSNELTKTEKENLEKRQADQKEASDKAAAAAKEAADKAAALRKEQLDALKADLDAKITLETNSENTSREKLKALLDKRYAAEISDKKLSDDQKLVLQQEYAKKLEDAIKSDEDVRQKRREAELNALIQLETESANTSRMKLKELLDERMNEELSAIDISEAEKEVIRQKYAKQLEEALKADDEKRKKDRIDALQAELDLNKNNSDAQIEVYNKLQQELTTSTSYSELERAALRKTYQDAILQSLDSANQAEIAKTEEKYGEFRRFDEAYYQDLRDEYTRNEQALKDAFAKGAINQDEYTKRISASSKARRELDVIERTSALDKTKLIGDALGQLSSIIGQDTAAGKAFAVAKATIDTYQSAVSAYAALSGIPVIGPALGAIAAGAAVASGIATVKKIVSVQVPNAPGGAGGNLTQTTPSGPAERPSAINVSASPIKFAVGGLVRGPGTETSDSIPAMLSDGEFVVNARSTRLFQPILSAINASADLPGFAMGGLVDTNRDRPAKDNTDTIAEAINVAFRDQPIRTYVTAGEISNEQQFDRIIKSRSLI